MTTSTRRKIRLFPRRSGPASSPDTSLPDSVSIVSSLSNDTNDQISSTDYARKRKELMALITGLQEQGAYKLIKFPRIAVIGGQSAGKSSLVEAVTGINVPRDSGTCTRCPMECTVSTFANTWSCQVSLRYEDVDSSPSKNFSPLLTDKRDVEIWLRRAQAAILSPHRQTDFFANKSREELQTLQQTDPKMSKFSRNVVWVDIKDPNATDLSFVDLPGLVQNEDPDVVQLVKDLVVSNIQISSTIILVTIPMTDEMENQLAFRLAKEADPQGSRTIGVLTKPDNLKEGDVGARQRWVDVIEGQSHRLTHGYYCVRLPDDAQRQSRISRSDAERLATDFFNQHSPWKDVSDRRRLGITNFVIDLSRLLMGLIEEAQTVAGILAECNADLARLPAPSLAASDPGADVLQRVSDFCSELKDMVYGRQGGQKDLIHRNKAVYRLFQREIRGTAPDFRPFESCVNYTKPRFPDDEDGDLDPQIQPLDLYAVRNVIQKHIGWELPGNIPFDASKDLIQSSVGLWRSPTETCFERAFLTFSDLVNALVVEHFQQFPQLERCVRDLIARKLDEIRRTAFPEIVQTLRREDEPFWTQNDHYFKSAKAKWLILYQDARRNAWRYELLLQVEREAAWSEFRNPGAERRALDALAELGFAGLSVSEFQRLHPPDQFQDELHVMAGVRAYFQVAYKRITDQVPMTIEHSMNQPFANGLYKALLGVLDIGSAERMRELLSEDSEMVQLRTELMEKKRRLEDIHRKLSQFVV
ncbi:hypothetical protein EW146_g8308 [Bondarzewia mesenterica]|uniref:GED domain-containing protein n=1 Tax=Bondarzewia mesenterica TaxID=1095465 RepID=A0A4S4LFP2_9AGAM|nr:hypothetical protein EW146_g8308 [Bondarzewia mesenterica]